MGILITGGAGYIGSNLAIRFNNPIIYDKINGLDILEGDHLLHKTHDVDVCYHLAAISGIKTCEKNLLDAFLNNVFGTYFVAKTMQELGVKLVFASSMATENYDSWYGTTKLLGEQIVRYFGGVICRIANVYGGLGFTEKKNTVIAQLMRPSFIMESDGTPTRDFVHVADVCDALLRASELPDGTLVTIKTGTQISINRLVKLSEESSFPGNLRKITEPGRLWVEGEPL